MPKKNTTRRKLAEHIVAVLKHPDTPVELYNAMTDELLAWTKYDMETVQEIDRILERAALETMKSA
jgi:hypothetical protein